MNIRCLLQLACVFSAVVVGSNALGNESGQSISSETRRDLIMARDAAWRSFFQENPAAAIAKAIAPGVIAIQENQEKWDDRSHLIAVAEAMHGQGIGLLRLEFPHTEIQVFGDTAILYYTYIFETGIEGKFSGTDAGRGTEVFVRRNGRWIDVGWHLDNGPRKGRLIESESQDNSKSN